MSERNHRGHLVLPDRFDCKNWYIAQLHTSRAARKCTTAAEESCTTRTMRENCKSPGRKIGLTNSGGLGDDSRRAWERGFSVVKRTRWRWRRHSVDFGCRMVGAHSWPKSASSFTRAMMGSSPTISSNSSRSSSSAS